MVYSGGALGGGVIFKDDICNFYSNTVTCNSAPDNGNGIGTATANVNGNGPTPYTYIWEPSGQTTATATGLSTGTYTVNITSATGCKVTSSSVIVGSISGMSIYPDPSNGNLIITMSGTSDKSTVEIYNTIGQEVYTGTLFLGKNNIGLNTEATGIYLYRVIDEDGSLIGEGKVMIQK